MNEAAFIFPAIKGYQAHREYYTSMVPLGVMRQLFQFVDEELPPEVRAQRTLNQARIPDICNYILQNPDCYVFSALTVSVDGALDFVPIDKDSPFIGNIHISMDARFLINDGQHRQAAIAEAIKQRPELKKEHISVVFYKDEGLVRSQQMFSDLNRYAIRPTKSINILFDSRNPGPIIAKQLVDKVDVFRGLTEKEKTSLSNRSLALFTLSAICTATEELLHGINGTEEEKTQLAIDYWTEVSKHMPEWKNVKSGEMKAAELREKYISSLSITLIALGAGGNTLIRNKPSDWKRHLGCLDHINWEKSNPDWDGLVFVNGKVAANRSTQKAMSEYIKKIMINDQGKNHG